MGKRRFEVLNKGGCCVQSWGAEGDTVVGVVLYEFSIMQEEGESITYPRQNALAADFLLEQLF